MTKAGTVISLVAASLLTTAAPAKPVEGVGDEIVPTREDWIEADRRVKKAEAWDHLLEHIGDDMMADPADKPVEALGNAVESTMDALGLCRSCEIERASEAKVARERRERFARESARERQRREAAQAAAERARPAAERQNAARRGQRAGASERLSSADRREAGEARGSGTADHGRRDGSICPRC